MQTFCIYQLLSQIKIFKLYKLYVRSNSQSLKYEYIIGIRKFEFCGKNLIPLA